MKLSSAGVVLFPVKVSCVLGCWSVPTECFTFPPDWGPVGSVVSRHFILLIFLALRFQYHEEREFQPRFLHKPKVWVSNFSPVTVFPFMGASFLAASSDGWGKFFWGQPCVSPALT